MHALKPRRLAAPALQHPNSASCSVAPLPYSRGKNHPAVYGLVEYTNLPLSQAACLAARRRRAASSIYEWQRKPSTEL